MKWFKHDSDANQDVKLMKLKMRYGMEGYGLYWHCLELVAAGIEKSNLTFELEHDSEIIAYQVGMHQDKVEQIMRAMIELGLFEADAGRVTCIKMALRLDQSMTNSPELRKAISIFKSSQKSTDVMTSSSECHDTAMTQSSNVMKEEKRREEKRKEYSADSVEVATYLSEKIKGFMPKAKANPDSWAKDIDLAIRLDRRTKDELISLIDYIYTSEGSFWQPNIRSGKKLREKFDTIHAQSIQSTIRNQHLAKNSGRPSSMKILTGQEVH